ncbi:MAG: protein-L-isoaspartate(D-aspartate) O-methyltransferase [Gammaproteobacteria bacterium]
MVSDQQMNGIGMTSQRARDRLIKRLEEKGIADRRVLEIMRSTPRHLFVDEALSHRAYEDSALPIGHNQTISQPYIVALMTQAVLAGGRPKKVLEIGTGSGYQTAILAQLCDEVWSVERIRPLQELARQRLRLLKLHNVQLRHSDGGFGWPEQAPFEAILCAAAPGIIPQELLDQLAPGGRLVIPVATRDDRQELQLVIRTDSGYSKQVLEEVRFVPFLRGSLS